VARVEQDCTDHRDVSVLVESLPVCGNSPSLLLVHLSPQNPPRVRARLARLWGDLKSVLSDRATDSLRAWKRVRSAGCSTSTPQGGRS
jgi:hypothetical protein